MNAPMMDDVQLPQLGLPNPLWSFLLALFAAIALSAVLRASVDAQPDPGLDWRDSPNALGLRMQVEVVGSTATYKWAAEGEGVTCELDANGDGELDYRLPDCRARTELVHRFANEEDGVFFPTLLARSADGRAGIARARVEVQ